MAGTTTGINPYKIKMGTMLRAERAFNVKVMPLMKRLERSGTIDVEQLEIAELMTLVFVSLELAGTPRKAAEIEEMELDELSDLMGSLGAPDASSVDPTSPPPSVDSASS